VTPDQPADKWFHENRLVIRDDEAILDKLPVVIRIGRKLYSASEGEFPNYRAKFIRKTGRPFLSAAFVPDLITLPFAQMQMKVSIHSNPQLSR